jgi:hypothetical protein
MRKKDKPLEITNKHSQKIIDLLYNKQGDDTLYYISKEIDMQQGSFRRKLENPKGWSEVHIINGILEFFNISYDELFRDMKPDEKNVREEINRLNSIVEKQSELIETFKGVMKAIRSLSDEAFQKFSGKDLVELMWKSMNEKIEYTVHSKKSISN